MSLGRSSIIIPMILALVYGYCEAETASPDVMVSATILSKSNCQFNSKTAVLSFGDLDPAAAVNINATPASVNFVCRGSTPQATFQITSNKGQNAFLGSYRMKRDLAPDDFLPYELTFSPNTGTINKNTDQTLTINGFIKGTDYANATSGTYSDAVILTIKP